MGKGELRFCQKTGDIFMLVAAARLADEEFLEWGV